jgi:tetratricopeptide (TPR) repeat protein
MGIHGIGYAPDPVSSYASNSANMETVDYLQFPSQTFTYKAGDCDDLSILYTALLESVGIETAFITVPGHIFMAFCLDKSPREARATFANPDDLIVQGEKTWIPIEITLIKNGFLKAWKEGAKEWRASTASGTAGLFPIREAWKTYEPVGISVVKDIAAPPDSARVLASYNAEMKAFTDSDMKPRADALVKLLNSDPSDIGLLNKLGVLYARYGMLSQAKARFLAVLKLTKDPPASTLTNLGNVAYLSASYSEAMDYFRRALIKTPESPVALLGLLLSAYEAGDRDTVDVTLKALQKVDPESASKYYYLGTDSGSSGRAASAEREISLWGD